MPWPCHVDCVEIISVGHGLVKNWRNNKRIRWNGKDGLIVGAGRWRYWFVDCFGLGFDAEQSTGKSSFNEDKNEELISVFHVTSLPADHGILVLLSGQDLMKLLR